MMKKLILGLVALMALTFVACEDEDTTNYIVDFNSNGGSYVSTQLTEEGNIVNMPEVPTMANSTFEGWLLNDSLYDFTLTVDSGFTLIAQWTTTDGNMRVVGFEDVLLSEMGLNQNDSISGSITSGDLSLSCSWTTSTWGTYGSGFSISNHSDITTSGYTNPYSSSAANGAYNSEKFAVSYGNKDSVKFDAPIDMESVMLCNNTYAYLSMLNGDNVAKKFETDDYFKLTLTLYGEDNALLGDKDFYLADFRDGKSLIVNKWTKLDLSQFKGVSYIKFSYESTDMGDWGMNTPTYFCLDNISYYAAE